MPSSSSPSAETVKPSSTPRTDPPVALRPRAPSQPTYADILSSMAPAADTISFNNSNTNDSVSPPLSVLPAQVESGPSTSPLAPSAVDSSLGSTSRLPLPRSVTGPAVSQLSALEDRDPGPRTATLDGGAAFDGKQQRQTVEEAQGKQPSSDTAAPAPSSAAAKLVLEKLTLYETKTVRMPEVCALLDADELLANRNST